MDRCHVFIFKYTDIDTCHSFTSKYMVIDWILSTLFIMMLVICDSYKNTDFVKGSILARDISTPTVF